MNYLLFLIYGASLVWGKSSGAPICDALGVCSSGKCPDGMDKVAPPTRNPEYTVRTSDGDFPEDDPKTYVPGEIMDIHIRAHSYNGKYIGILIYAVDGSGLGAKGCQHSPGCDGSHEKKVGEWIVAPTEKFQASCGGQAITHIDANKKNFHTTLHWKAPETSGKVYFRAIVKVGPTQGGWFYWPMETDLALTAAPRSESGISWIKGQKGNNCKQTCRNENLMCDDKAMSGPDVYDEFKSSHVCPKPMLSGCSKAADTPFVDSEGLCHIITESCEKYKSSCGAKIADGERFCACSDVLLESKHDHRFEDTVVDIPEWAFAAGGAGGVIFGCLLVALCKKSNGPEDLQENLYMDTYEESVLETRKI